jgi:hypothetical protein
MLGVGAFLLFNVCVRSVINVFPDTDERRGQRSAPLEAPAEPEVRRSFRITRDGPAPATAPGWFRYVAADGSFSLIGPGRPTQAVSSRSGVFTFRNAAGVVFVAEVRSLGGGSGAKRPRAILDRETAILLDDLGVLEHERRWSGFGQELRLEVEARRADRWFSIWTFVNQRRLYRAYAERRGDAEPGVSSDIDAFVMGLVPRGPT